MSHVQELNKPTRHLTYGQDKVHTTGIFFFRAHCRQTHALSRSLSRYTGAAQSIDESECSRPRSASRIQTPPLQRCTHRTPGCAPLKRRRHSPARSTCAAAPVLRSSPLGADMVRKSRNSFADVLFTPGLLALMPPTICCVRSQSVSDLVTEISGGATPAPVRCGSEL